jgi:hypothetical protein
MLAVARQVCSARAEWRAKWIDEASCQMLGHGWAGLFIIAAMLLRAVQRWVGSERFRLHVHSEASLALGVAVELRRIDVALWPLPAVVLVGIQIQTLSPRTLERLEVWPVLQGLLLSQLALFYFHVNKVIM